MDIAKGESTEKELDALIRRHHDQRVSEEDKRIEDLWVPSVLAYNRRRAEERRQEFLQYHEGQAARLSSTLGALVSYHEAEAERYRNGSHEEQSV